jgi:hypothetical protein
MSLANDGVFNFVNLDESPNLINAPQGDCKALVDIQASRRYRESGISGDGVEWYRIPINGIEQWINKDGPAAINRTTKVRAFDDVLVGRRNDIPTFGLVGGTNPDAEEKPLDDYTLDKYFQKMLIDRDPEENNDAFVRARVWFYDEEIDEYVLTQHGYISSYSPTDNTLLRNFWIYDVADLARDIPVGKGFDNPTIKKLINFVLNGTDDTGKAVGINNTTPFTVTNVVFPSSDQLASRTIKDIEFERLKSELFRGVDEQGELTDASAYAFDVFTSPKDTIKAVIRGLGGGEEEFSRNRNNMVDVLNAIGTLIDGVWYFEPSNGGVELHFRANWSKTDYGRTFQDQTQVDDTDKFTVTLKENTALVDIKPINTISVNGNSVARLPNGDREASGPTVLTGESFTSQYPHVKLRYDPFYEAAGNQELGPTDVRSDATDLETAERQAYEEFIAHVEETTEGRIELFGDPMPLPYDFIDAVPACRGQQVANRDPLPYSINDVHHKKYAGQQFVTELGVHAKVEGDPIDGDGSNFTIESEYRQAQ